jgi:hypothetical protein
MLILEQSTAYTLKIGPFLDDADGNTVEGALAITQADVRLSKNGGNIAQKNEAAACVHDELGWYNCTIDATDTDTLGRLQLFVHEAGALTVWHEYMVVPANTYDSLVLGTDYLDSETAAMAAGVVTAAAIANAAIDAATFAAGAIDAAATAADFLAEVNAEVVDVMTVDTIAEMAQQQPPVAPTIAEMMSYLYMALRNRGDATATLKEFHNDAGAVIHKKVLSDDGVTYSEAKSVTGP